jgi:hypothetical protein
LIYKNIGAGCGKPPLFKILVILPGIFIWASSKLGQKYPMSMSAGFRPDVQGAGKGIRGAGCQKPNHACTQPGTAYPKEFTDRPQFRMRKIVCLFQKYSRTRCPGTAFKIKNCLKVMHKITIALLFLFTLASCDKDKETSGSRAVQYELTGNFTGEFSIAYTAANGSFETIEVTKLPWTKEFVADNDVKAISIAANGNGGTPGQTAVLKIKIGKEEKKSGSGVANSIGIISLNPAAYIF